MDLEFKLSEFETVADYAIIGAGPAGLSFADGIRKLDKNAICYVIDMGKHISMRKHDNTNDLATGAGGAGFFSDGKFSFFPAGTNV